MKSIGAIFSLLITFPAVAGSLSYECKINGEYTQDEKGKLIEGREIYLGKTFNVERETGVVLGRGLSNSSYPTRQVLDRGGKEQSYKLIWVSKDVAGTDGGKNVVFLSIFEYEVDPLKPFMVVEGSSVLTGVCE